LGRGGGKNSKKIGRGKKESLWGGGGGEELTWLGGLGGKRNWGYTIGEKKKTLLLNKRVAGVYQTHQVRDQSPPNEWGSKKKNEKSAFQGGMCFENKKLKSKSSQLEGWEKKTNVFGTWMPEFRIVSIKAHAREPSPRPGRTMSVRRSTWG